MNGKKAKALRRLNTALEQEKLAFQEMIRRGTPVPVKTMSMDDFNKARGIGVISTTPRTPDIVEDNPVLEEILESRRATKALMKTGLMDGLEPGAASSANKRCSEVLAHQHQSINGPEAYAKLGSMGTKFKLTDTHGDKGVICEVIPDDYEDKGKE